MGYGFSPTQVGCSKEHCLVYFVDEILISEVQMLVTLG